jgi:hypothetical protein
MLRGLLRQLAELGGYAVRETGEMKNYLRTEALWEAARTLVVTGMTSMPDLRHGVQPRFGINQAIRPSSVWVEVLVGTLC